jgi:hypothetical protein
MEFVGKAVVRFIPVIFNIKPKTQKRLSYYSNALEAYLRPLIVDIATVAIAINLLVNVGHIGEWNNEAWHLVVIIGSLLIVAIRSLSRLIFKVTLGEKIMSQRPIPPRTQLVVTSLEGLAVLIIYIYVIKL